MVEYLEIPPAVMFLPAALFQLVIISVFFIMFIWSAKRLGLRRSNGR